MAITVDLECKVMAVKSFTELIDTPSTYTDQAGKTVFVNNTEDALEFREVATTTITPEQYGAIGDGVTDDTVAVQSAITAAGEGGVIDFKSTATYLLTSRLVGLSRQTFIGKGATFKRQDAKVTTTTTVVGTSDTTFNVANASLFNIGEDIILLDVTSPNLGTAYQEESAIRKMITGISGNTITVNGVFDLPTNGNLLTSYPTGTKVLKVYPLLAFIGAFNKQINISGLNIDGNKSNNTEYLGWNHNGSIDNLGSNTVVYNCHFKDIPNENLFLDDHCLIHGNSASNLNGSFTHISKESEPSNEGFNKIDNNNLVDVCKTPLNISGHNEAAFTYSARSKNVFITNNSVETCGGSFFGVISNGPSENDSVATVSNNMATNISGVCKGLVAESGIMKGYKITDNYFENYDYIHFATLTLFTLPKGGGFDDIIIKGNTFLNGRCLFESCSNLLVSDNNFINEDGYVPLATSIPISNKDYANHIAFNLCVGVSLKDNTFVNQAVIQSIDLTNWMMLDLAATTYLKSDGSTNTDYFYGGRNFNISGNTVSGYSNGFRQNTNVGPGTKGMSSYIGVNIKNNIITQRKDSDSNISLEVTPGMVVENNTLIGNSNATYAIFAYPTDVTKNTELNGVIVRHNTIIGFSTAVRLGRATGLEPRYNAFIEYNVSDGAFSDQTSGLSTVANNTTLPASEVILLDLARDNSGFY